MKTKTQLKKQTFDKLYNHNKNPSQSIKGTGYGSKKKALETLKIIKTAPLTKQKQIVITMYYRAKHHKNRTKGMNEAMKVYSPWMIKNNIRTRKSSTRKSSTRKSSTRKSSTKKLKGRKELIDCCKSTKINKKCIRKKDNKIFSLPRKFSKQYCLTNEIKGFSMKSSCSPYINC